MPRENRHGGGRLTILTSERPSEMKEGWGFEDWYDAEDARDERLEIVQEILLARERLRRLEQIHAADGVGEDLAEAGLGELLRLLARGVRHLVDRAVLGRVNRGSAWGIMMLYCEFLSLPFRVRDASNMHTLRSFWPPKRR